MEYLNELGKRAADAKYELQKLTAAEKKHSALYGGNSINGCHGAHSGSEQQRL